MIPVDDDDNEMDIAEVTKSACYIYCDFVSVFFLWERQCSMTTIGQCKVLVSFCIVKNFVKALFKHYICFNGMVNVAFSCFSCLDFIQHCTQSNQVWSNLSTPQTPPFKRKIIGKRHNLLFY